MFISALAECLKALALGPRVLALASKVQPWPWDLESWPWPRRFSLGLDGWGLGLEILAL